jgi:predicted DNA-binding transcriptional regulator AlpA
MGHKSQIALCSASGLHAYLPDRALTPKEAARMTGFAPKTLANWRTAGGGPPYIAVGRSIRYMESSTLKWLRDREQRSTSVSPRPGP